MRPFFCGRRAVRWFQFFLAPDTIYAETHPGSVRSRTNALDGALCTRAHRPARPARPTMAAPITG